MSECDGLIVPNFTTTSIHFILVKEKAEFSNEIMMHY